jgi:hypothetical protein
MTGYSWSTPMAMPALGVNGPEDDVLDWDSVNWRVHEDNVRRLRQRIFTRGLLEPYAATSGTYGSEGGSAGQPAGPTRRTTARCGSRP